MRTSNPVLSERAFDSVSGGRHDSVDSNVMTLEGTVNKTGLMLLALGVAAAVAWSMCSAAPGMTGTFNLLFYGGTIAGLVLALVIVFKAEMAPVLAIPYAVAEGLSLGSLSTLLEQVMPGIGVQALGLTVGIALSLLVAYRAGLVRATEKFRSIVFAATGGVMLLYLVSFVMGFFGVGVPFLHDNGVVGIGISAVIVVIAALNLVLDFDFIERNAERGAPKFMEWYASFGLVVTLVWLYVEVLRLLSKLRRD